LRARCFNFERELVIIRLFLAINFPGEVVERVWGIIEKVRENSAGGKFMEKENVHLMLEFLGEVEPGRLPAIRKIMDGLNAAPFELRLNKAGTFRRQEGDVCWIGVEENPALLDLQKKLHDALAAEGFSLEERKYTPHITIGRKVKLKAGFPLSAINRELKGLTAHIEKIHLMRSQLTEKGPVYTVLHSKLLG